MQPSLLPRAIGALVVGVLCCTGFLASTPCPAGPVAVTGVGVMGDSVADEYHFAKIIEPGGDRRKARSFVEVLSATRGLNFGPISTVSRGSPRNQGFQYDWAEEADRSADLISKGQHTGLAEQVGAGQVDLAWMFIGGNDFRDLYSPQVIGSSDPGTAIEQTVVTLATNVSTAIQTLLTVNPQLNIVVANVPDLRSIPGLKQVLAQNPALVPFAAAVDQGIQAYNQQLDSIAAGNSHVAVVDAYGFSQPAVAGQPVKVSFLTLDTNVPGNSAVNYFVDAIHPGTAASGLLGNLFIDASNAKFNTGLNRLSDREIASFAVPLPAPVGGGIAMMTLAGVVVWRKRRAAA